MPLMTEYYYPYAKDFMQNLTYLHIKWIQVDGHLYVAILKTFTQWSICSKLFCDLTVWWGKQVSFSLQQAVGPVEILSILSEICKSAPPPPPILRCNAPLSVVFLTTQNGNMIALYPGPAQLSITCMQYEKAGRARVAYLTRASCNQKMAKIYQTGCILRIFNWLHA